MNADLLDLRSRIMAGLVRLMTAKERRDLPGAGGEVQAGERAGTTDERRRDESEERLGTH